MKSKTIWESASRPLFVRSVWLESSHEGRGVQHRHFILDYEPEVMHFQQQRKQLRSAVYPIQSWKKSESLRNSISCDLSELSSSFESQRSDENLLLIDSEKIKLQQPINLQTKQQLKLLKLYKKPTFTRQIRKKGADCYEYNLNRHVREKQEMYSRHSSLQDLQSTLSMTCLNPEERLAERVLNWLDLAGKNAIVKNQEDEQPIEMMENENSFQNQEIGYQLRQYEQQQHQQSSHNQLPRQRKKSRNHLNRFFSHQSACSLAQQNYVKRSHRDAVKPITIIFNRDGFPVRLNRPPRNIDLCTLASSAGATRRLAGSLASARLYHGNETITYKPRVIKTFSNASDVQRQQTARSLHTSRSRNNTEVEKSAAQSSQKRTHEDLPANQTQDSKRQLHIFMPSLPKKGILSTSPSLLSAYGADDSSIGLLSHKFNESCTL